MKKEFDTRPWYTKKRYIGTAVVATVFGFSALGGSTPGAISNQAPVTPKAPDTSIGAAVRPAVDQFEIEASGGQSPSARDAANLSNDNYYTNVDGNRVHAPAYSETGCAAVGATAQCRDGTCSFSQNRRGTCSHHGGVAEWL